MTKIVKKGALDTAVSKTTLQALMTDVTPDSAKVYRFDGTTEYYKRVTAQGAKTYEGNYRVAFLPGHTYTLAEINDMYQAATVTSVSPSTGAAAGGTAVTITGTNFGGSSGVTFGGTAATSVVVVSDKTITCVTPAKSAGAYNVVVTDDSGAATLTNGFTYS